VVSDKGKGGKQEVRYDDEVDTEPILEKLSGPRHTKWIPLADDDKAITKFNLDDNETSHLTNRAKNRQNVQMNYRLLASLRFTTQRTKNSSLHQCLY